MALNVSYVQQSYQGLDLLSLKSTTRDILANAQAKANTVSQKSVDINLYNGEIDALTAKQVAMSGAGLQVTLNNNLETAIKFLKTKAAETTVKPSADVVLISEAKKDKKGSNPFYNGDVMNFNKKEETKKESSDYLFITAA
jgi:hypothetical protein